MENAISHTTVFLTSFLLSNMLLSLGLVFLQIPTKDKE